MASFNSSHHDSGGVVLFSGELILLFVDSVTITCQGHGKDVTGRLYLTTHRVIFTSSAIRSGSQSQLKSFSAPFYAMFDLNLEQPIFGANFISGKVRPETHPDGQGISFKLKFAKGGAIEFGQAMDNASRQASRMAREMQFRPPVYQQSQDQNMNGQYYQAPPNTYQPAYNCGFALPTQVFPTPPPAGFIYAMEAPPPYPGLNTRPAQNFNGQQSQYQSFPVQGYVMPVNNAMAMNGGMTGMAFGAPMVGGMNGMATPMAMGIGMSGLALASGAAGPNNVYPNANQMTSGYPGVNPGYSNGYPGPGYPSTGYPSSTASAPQAPPIGFFGQENLPSYDEATNKKKQ